MKASLKIRDEQKPILKAKIPLNILGFPFRSGIESGEAKELCLSFSTLFESGPLIKLCYRPNDSWKPFGFVVRTGIGRFGSPIGAPLSMSAEFNFVGNGSPKFLLHFKPQFGDFLIKQSVNSQDALPLPPRKPSIAVSKDKDDDDSGNSGLSEEKELSVKNDGGQSWTGLFPVKGASGFTVENAMEKLFSGGEICARTLLPVKDRAVVKVRWSVRLPTDDDRDSVAMFRRIPYLEFRKIGIEHLTGDKKIREHDSSGDGVDVAETCRAVKRELDMLRMENGLLRKDIEELRAGMGGGKFVPVVGIKRSGRSEFGKKQTRNGSTSDA